MADPPPNPPSTTACEHWGRRLSDALRGALGAADLAEARRLALEGDGQSRSLAKEYALMFRGLCITVGVLMEQMRAAACSGAALTAAAQLVREFRQGFAQDVAEAWGGPLPGGESAAALEAEVDAASKMLEEAQRQFDSEHGRMAGAIVAAIERGDAASAAQLVDRKEAAMYVPLHDRLVRFMADAFAWAYRTGGAQGLLAFHMDTAQAMRDGFERWERMSPREFAWATAFLLKQHMGEVTVRESAERFTFEQRLCGSGGRLRREGAYERGAQPLPFVEAEGALTFGRGSLPVYCTHCPVWNGVAPLRWYGHPHWVFDNPARADGSCTLHLYKNPQDVPQDYAQMLGSTALE